MLLPLRSHLLGRTDTLTSLYCAVVPHAHSLGCSSTASWCFWPFASVWRHTFTLSSLRRRTRPSSKYKMSLDPPKDGTTPRVTASGKLFYQRLYRPNLFRSKASSSCQYSRHVLQFWSDSRLSTSVSPLKRSAVIDDDE